APSNVTVNVDAASCTATGVALGTPVTSDNCGIDEVTNDAAEPFAIGTTTVTWTVTDNAGNTATATQTVTVVDNINPSASNPAPITVQCIADVPVADITVVDDETDNCSGTITVA